MEHESDGDTTFNWYTRYSLQMIITVTGVLESLEIKGKIGLRSDGYEGGTLHFQSSCISGHSPADSLESY